SASQNAARLRLSSSSLFRQSRRSHSASSRSRYRNSASHSCRQSARRRRGTITPITAISQRWGLVKNCLRREKSGDISTSRPRRLLIALLVEQRLLQQPVALDCFSQSLVPCARHLVILARRSLRGLRAAVLPPLRGPIARPPNPPQRRIDRPARQARDVYDVEPVLIAAGHRL